MLNQYSAISAKVHGMYGRRLKAADYEQLMAMHSVEEILLYLRSRPDWGSAIAHLTPPINRSRLENALRRQYMEEYISLYGFLRQEDRAVMRFPVYKTERDEILTALRRAHTRSHLEDMPPVPDFYCRHSGVDFTALRAADSQEEILNSIRGSIYYAPLLAFSRSAQSGVYYPAVETLMQSVYYGKMFKQASACRGPAQKLLKKSLSQESDLLNIIHFLRLRRYFSQQEVQAYAFPFNFSHRLTETFIHDLLAAPDYNAAIALLRQSPYGSLFTGSSPEQIEAQYDELVYKFNRAQLHRAEPSVYMPIAYLSLKDFELQNLIRIIECVRYGVDPRQAASHLVGIHEE